MYKMLLASQGLTIDSIVSMLTGSVVRRVCATRHPAVNCMLPSVRDEVSQLMDDKNHRRVLAGVGDELLKALRPQFPAPELLTKFVKDVVRMSSPTFKKMIDSFEADGKMCEFNDGLVESVVSELVLALSTDEPNTSVASTVVGADLEQYKLVITAIRTYISEFEGKVVFPDLDGLID